MIESMVCASVGPMENNVLSIAEGAVLVLDAGFHLGETSRAWTVPPHRDAIIDSTAC